MQKLTEINIGGNDYNMAGCALTGVCATAAADYIKAVTLSDGENLFDGMAVIVAFANGNTAGNAPNAQTIYSSDQVNYYSDAELTQPFTLAPSGCYSVEYTGTANAYTYLSYPVIMIGNITGRVCDGRGKPAAGSLWSAGDRVMFIYSDGDFFILPALTNTIAAGNTCAVTSNAVAGALNSKLSVVEVNKGIGNFGTVTDILNFFASNEGRALVPEGGARLVKLGTTSSGDWHNVYVGSTNSTYFTITIFSFYFPLQSWQYANGTWGHHDDTVDIVTGSTLVGGGSYKLKRCGKVVTLDIWGCSIAASAGEVSFLTLPEGYKPSETFRAVGDYGGGSLSGSNVAIFSIYSSGSVAGYTYSAFESSGEQLHAVWIVD